MSNRNYDDQDDAGAPIPSFGSARNIQLGTVAPAFGVSVPPPSSPYGNTRQPEYLDYEQKRNIMVRMFSNAGLAYCMGIVGGGIYGLKYGIDNSPTLNRRVQFNSILNHGGRYGSKIGNTIGCFAIFYTLYEGAADHFELDRLMGFQYTTSPTISAMVSPLFGAAATGATYYAPSGYRAAGAAGAVGFGIVSGTYFLYSLIGYPYGYMNFLFF